MQVDSSSRQNVPASFVCPWPIARISRWKGICTDEIAIWLAGDAFSFWNFSLTWQACLPMGLGSTGMVDVVYYNTIKPRE